MRSRSRTVLLFLATLPGVSIPLPSRADPAPGQAVVPPFPPSRRDVEEQVERLGAETFAEREEAQKRLLDLAAAGPGEVMLFLPATHPDPEVEERLEVVRRRAPWERFRRRAEREAEETPSLRAAVPILLRALETEGLAGIAHAAPAEPEAPVRIALALLVAEMGILDDPDPAVRVEGIEILQRLGAPEVAPRIARLLEDTGIAPRERLDGSSTTPVRLVALRTLRTLADPAATERASQFPGPDVAPGVAPLLTDPEPSVRGEAARTLAQIGAAGEAPRIAALLTDPEPYPRARAARALAQLGWREGTAGVERLLTDPVPGVRAAAVESLATLGGAAAVPVLAPRLGDPVERVREAAVRAIGEAGDPGAVALLAPLLDLDPSPTVQQAAAVTIARLGGFELHGNCERQIEQARAWWRDRQGG